MCYKLELFYYLLNYGAFLLHGFKPFIAKPDGVFMKRGKSTCIMEALASPWEALDSTWVAQASP